MKPADAAAPECVTAQSALPAGSTPSFPSVVEPTGFALRPTQRLAMLALNTLPLLHVLAIAATAAIGWTNWPWRAASATAVLYLAPLLIAALVRVTAPVREGRIRAGSGPFFAWWALANLQMLFCRLPFLEELLRLVPGLYSLWLRGWGARIGRLTYWGAGLRILDRSFLRVGDDVVFGAAVRLNAHVLRRDERGEFELLLGTIVIGDRALIGGYSLLTAGTEIAAGEATRAFTISPPFNVWSQGKRRERMPAEVA